jgi:hypothetical protein
MPPTTTHGLRYPSPTDEVRDGADAIHELASDVDDAITANATAIAANTAALAGKASTASVAAKAPLKEVVKEIAAAGAARTVDLADGTLHRYTLTANLTLTFPAPEGGLSFTVVLVQDATGGRTVTWPASVRWPGGVAPVITSTALKGDVFTFLCTSDSSGLWVAFVAGQNY